MTSRFTVAVCTRNRADVLALCLDALAASIDAMPGPFESRPSVPVVVVDNASTDDTHTAAEAFADRLALRVIAEPRLGLSHARNAALAACETEFLVYLDDDARPLDGWATAIADGVERHTPDVFGGPYRPFYLQPKPLWLDDALGSAHLDLTEGRLDGECLSGGNMGWRTTLLRDLGGFSPDLGMVGGQLRLGEETQLQKQIYAERPEARIVFLPAMEMLHLVAPVKMRARYWWRRAWDYGWRLAEIAPDDPIASMPAWRVAAETRLGLPLALRLVARDRTQYPTWRAFSVAYGSRAAILWGALARRWTTHVAP